MSSAAAYWQEPPEQRRLAQSVPTKQRPPAGQPGQLPPQSSSDSSWFQIPSVQVGVVHTLDSQT